MSSVFDKIFAGLKNMAMLIKQTLDRTTRSQKACRGYHDELAVAGLSPTIVGTNFFLKMLSFHFELQEALLNKTVDSTKIQSTIFYAKSD